MITNYMHRLQPKNLPKQSTKTKIYQIDKLKIVMTYWRWKKLISPKTVNKIIRNEFILVNV